MSNMVLGQAPAARVLPLARGAREGGLVVTDRPNFQVSFTRERVPKSASHTHRDTRLLNRLPTPITTIRSPRLLNKLNVSPRDTQTSVCVMWVGPRII